MSRFLTVTVLQNEAFDRLCVQGTAMQSFAVQLERDPVNSVIRQQRAGPIERVGFRSLDVHLQEIAVRDFKVGKQVRQGGRPHLYYGQAIFCRTEQAGGA